MGYDRYKHHRRSIRLKGYDYSMAGAYYVTMCAHKRECLFGKIIDGIMILNGAGQMARKCWEDIPYHYPGVMLDEWIVMPNHLHGILIITNRGNGGTNDCLSEQIPDYRTIGANDYSPLRYRPKGTSKTIGAIIRGYKIGVTKWFLANLGRTSVWQRNYYEHIIRDDGDLNNIRGYIENNPTSWEEDKLIVR